ncbi:hypothetical protein NOM68_18725, partial [Proteus mirabilis]|uniref:hypothetical protein n=1 Tax=Proteus mirabilis TaxID=584 RepID=UPI00217DFC68
VSDKYVWKILLQQLGSLVYEDGILNFNLLLNHLLILSFTNVNGTYKWYRNLTSIIVADLLMEVVEEE